VSSQTGKEEPNAGYGEHSIRKHIKKPGNLANNSAGRVRKRRNKFAVPGAVLWHIIDSTAETLASVIFPSRRNSGQCIRPFLEGVVFGLLGRRGRSYLGGVTSFSRAASAHSPLTVK
jgi:hypothetical protein